MHVDAGVWFSAMLRSMISCALACDANPKPRMRHTYSLPDQLQEGSMPVRVVYQIIDASAKDLFVGGDALAHP